MKNLKRLSKKDLKTIKGGSAPSCDLDYKACVTGRDENGAPVWDCLPPSYPC
ncbi:bacteriocin-like protein [Chryseobacterium sp. 52]|uniref:bacteriocin-like protein n=1 Tax=Chryseobacterium sp. 52 TaxID=2035213 RepID=UPI000C46E4C0|nr:bacteriocin-like protein [Chryseobacterium sp. 52]